MVTGVDTVGAVGETPAGGSAPGCGAGSGTGCPGSLADEGVTGEGGGPFRVDIVYGT